MHFQDLVCNTNTQRTCCEVAVACRRHPVTPLPLSPLSLAAALADTHGNVVARSW